MVIRCLYCRSLIMWLTLPGGRRCPFDYELVEVGDLGERRGWLVCRIPTRGGAMKAVAMPMENCSSGMVLAARRALVRHRCDEYDRAMRELDLSRQERDADDRAPWPDGALTDSLGEAGLRQRGVT